jgi:hypothetical protein
LSAEPCIAAENLDVPTDVDPSSWIDEPYLVAGGHKVPSDPKVAAPRRSFSTLHGLENGITNKEHKTYLSISPLPTFTRSGLVRVFIPQHGTQFLSLSEMARASSFDKGTIDFLLSLPWDCAMAILGNAIPHGLLRTMYRAITDAIK